MKSRITTVFLVTAIIGLVLLMLPASMVESAPAKENYDTAVFGVS